jgi:putative hemolysin
VKILSVSTDLLLQLLRARSSQDPPVTEEEVRLLLEEGTEAGVFAEAEQDLVEQVFRLADRRVEEIMTPRPRIVWLDVDAPPKAVTRERPRQPICAGSVAGRAAKRHSKVRRQG